METGGMKRGEEFGCGFVELLGAGEPDVCGYLNLGEEEGGDGEVEEGFLMRYPPPPPPLSSTSRTRMLCFGGDKAGSESQNGFSRKKKQSTGGSETSSSTSSSSSNTSLCKPKLEKKAANRGSRSACTAAGDPERGATAAKKARKENQKTTSEGGTAKVRKAKIGDRIIALQQLVSPFGKSDTASVLHEALGYIKFLHDQVQVLSSPYLQQLPSSSSDHLQGRGGGVRPRGDLRSRGLRLVPISCMAHVAGSNGADLWSPAIGSSDHCNGDHAVPKH